eukprot:NODE_573_length_5876_cov_0.470833.p6 type:complete len:114 gc:universal NODE_573_length_5876_cov_0.470833:5704-5363(-)
MNFLLAFVFCMIVKHSMLEFRIKYGNSNELIDHFIGHQKLSNLKYSCKVRNSFDQFRLFQFCVKQIENEMYWEITTTGSSNSIGGFVSLHPILFNQWTTLKIGNWIFKYTYFK